MTYYNDNFYNNMCSGAIKSANVLDPILIDMFNPSSVIDVGCGRGYWLKPFYDHGIKITGCDGEYNVGKLVIPDDCFKPIDLFVSDPSYGKYDLVVSLEVAEHLPEARASQFINALCSLSDIVVFSAAIPGQQGTNHINEQWPEYWAEKFASRGFYPVDIIRDVIWDNTDVEICYRQNTIIYTTKDNIKKYGLQKYVRNSLSKVHPEFYLMATDKDKICIRNLITNRLSKKFGFGMKVKVIE